jgi:hypothetical protein
MLFFFLLCPELLELQAGAFFLQFCDVAHSGNHPPKELVKFGYRSETRKVERFRNESCCILVTSWNLLSKYDSFREKKNPQKQGYFGTFFSQKSFV